MSDVAVVEPKVAQMVLELEDAGALTLTSLVLTDPHLEFDRYEALGRWFGQVSQSARWWVGDWLVFGSDLYGEQYAQAVAATGLHEQTLQRYQFVCANVPQDRRRQSLSFGVHHAVSRLEGAEQERWLKAAEKGGWNEAELRARMRAWRKEQKPQLPDLEDDPPEQTIDLGILQEAGRAIIRDARDHETDPGLITIPRETFSRLQAAYGE